jgi:hypothetical protein
MSSRRVNPATDLLMEGSFPIGDIILISLNTIWPMGEQIIILPVILSGGSIDIGATPRIHRDGPFEIGPLPTSNP